MELKEYQKALGQVKNIFKVACKGKRRGYNNNVDSPNTSGRHLFLKKAWVIIDKS